MKGRRGVGKRRLWGRISSRELSLLTCLSSAVQLNLLDVMDALGLQIGPHAVYLIRTNTKVILNLLHSAMASSVHYQDPPARRVGTDPYNNGGSMKQSTRGKKKEQLWHDDSLRW